MKSQDWDQRYATTELVWGAGPNRFLVSEVADLTPGRALDLGCGEGRNAIWLAERGWRVSGVDFSQAGLDKARRLAVDRGVEVTWVRADLLDYEPDHGAFDLVILMYIHLPAAQLADVMKTASAALAPGGTLLVVGHDLLNLSQGHGGPQDPELLFTPADIERVLPGLGIERAESVLRPLTVDGREVSAIDALVRAKRPLGAR
ncbi:MAG TPA: class I SAM-dependent methyltransferase [Candidatus Micrarchaeaceae archaeon]|nr:class I SAM-dependent methyltransferase [Candidatus Micrarchaeaceae archaeon]